MRALLLAISAFALAACGDDTISPPPDLAFPCPGTDIADCCHRGVIPYSMPPQSCPVVGASCLGFEFSCSCESDGTWHCHVFARSDMATPVFD